MSELIHTATLLHDDVVDDSDRRRGRLTVRKLFSPGTSLLIGDYWLTRAIHVLIEYGCPAEVLGIYSKAIEELAEGEILQMELADSLRATEEDYIEVIRRKTASLFHSFGQESCNSVRSFGRRGNGYGKVCILAGVQLPDQG